MAPAWVRPWGSHTRWINHRPVTRNYCQHSPDGSKSREKKWEHIHCQISRWEWNKIFYIGAFCDSHLLFHVSKLAIFRTIRAVWIVWGKGWILSISRPEKNAMFRRLTRGAQGNFLYPEFFVALTHFKNIYFESLYRLINCVSVWQFWKSISLKRHNQNINGIRRLLFHISVIHNCIWH